MICYKLEYRHDVDSESKQSVPFLRVLKVRGKRPFIINDWFLLKAILFLVTHIVSTGSAN